MNRFLVLSIALTCLVGFESCSMSGTGKIPQSTPLVTSVQTSKNPPTTTGKPPSPTPSKTQTGVITGGATGATDSISVVLTIPKDQIANNRQFIYNLDLQNSSLYDSGMDLYQQSLVVTSIPVYFRIAGDQLELVNDGTLYFPSDENHPEQLIGSFPILSQDDTTLTLGGLDSSGFLATQLGPVDPNSKVVSYQSHWIRSFEFDPNGNYILQESSVELSDGTTRGEFMESIFPRDNLKASPSFQVIPMDPKNPVGGTDGIVARYRFLPTDPIFHGENNLSYAAHIDLAPNADGSPATIEWYVTSNAPDTVLETLREAVEGWNRYFTKMKGFNRDVMHFAGRLPANIHLGDPRYNVINWDSRQVAGAAYESQGADPETGKQSHSLIYMPAAWLAIGTTYWQGGVSSDTINDGPSNAPISPTTLVGKRIGCARDIREGMMLLSSGRVVDTDIQNFATSLLKQTLFHEVGHSLGLAHNFEGSLAYDRSNPNSLFSYSIMDYNDYELERQAFDSVTSSTGPLLEYDRQAISALYDGSKDVASSDPTLLACNDAESDNQTGGVNPICIRYDAEKDPTLSVTTAFSRINQDTIDRDVTLSQALNRVPGLILTPDSLAAIHSQDDLGKLVGQFSSTLEGTLAFYLTSSVTSVNKAVRTNIRSLYQFDLQLPAPYDASAMRERVLAGVQQALALSDLPPGAKTALANAEAAGIQILSTTPFLNSLDSKQDAISQMTQSIQSSLSAYIQNTTLGLPAMRAKVLGSLNYQKQVDFFLGPENGNTKDYELAVVNILGGSVGNKSLSNPERIAAAQSLATFKGRLTGDNAITSLQAALAEERATVATNDQRATIEAIVTALGLN